MKNILFIGCHADDIELGCAGTLSKYIDNSDCYCVTLSKHSFSPLGEGGFHPDIWERQIDAMKNIGLKNDIIFFDYKTNYFENQRNEIWSTLKELNEKIKPSTVFINHNDDHQDHSTLYRETLRVFKECSVITYPTFGSVQNFPINMYERINKSQVKLKIKSLKNYFMYKDKNYIKNALNQLKINGTYINCKYAEVFNIIKIVN